MTALELRATLGLALVYMLRMFGLFLVVPVIALHAVKFPQATGLLVGLSVGIYGLTQALLQIPAGLLSDRIGRKKVILLGLAIFALGSVIAGFADSIGMLIAGRALQGCGAIAAATNALLADQVRTEFRSRSMAVLGMSIGLAFMLAIVLGPSFLAFTSHRGLFLIAAFGAVAAAIALIVCVPAEVKTSVQINAQTVSSETKPGAAVIHLGIAAFLLHFVLTGMFVQVPQLLAQWWPAESQGLRLYLPAMLISVAIVFPFLGKVERTGQVWLFGQVAMAIVGLSLIGAAIFSNQLWGLYLFVCLFFVGFNFLEASLPSAVSKVATTQQRGKAMGVFTSMQFAGAFAGGAVAGSLEPLGAVVVLSSLGGIALLWLPIAYFFDAPMELKAAT